MNKLKIRTVNLLYTLGVFMMLGHSIIPHHHHTDSILSHKENQCPTDKEQHEKKNELPFHCHAFNDTNWYQQNINAKNFAKNAVQFLSFCSVKINLTPTVSKKIKFAYKNVTVQDVFVNAVLSPRAPPKIF